jgi:capsular polysaccharide biosynthesis protein
MELRRYWQIIWRYWPVVAVLTLVGVIAALQYYVSNKPTFQAVATVNVTQDPSPNDSYSGIYANQASDYVNDELVKIITGNIFMKDVSSQLKEGSINFSPDELKGMVQVEPKNRTLTITASNNDQNAALKIAQTVANTLQNSAATYTAPRQVQVRIIDFPNQSNLNGGRNVLLAVVRILAGFLAGIALAFLLAYLDNKVRSKDEVEELLGLPVMGAIPVASKLEAITATQAVPQPEDPIVSARLNSVQRPVALPPVERPAPYIPAELPVAQPAERSALNGESRDGGYSISTEPEEVGATVVPAKPRRAPRPRKEPAQAKDELPRR